MIHIEQLEIAGLYPAMCALRLPYSQEPRSTKDHIDKTDIQLASKLVKSGDEHAKAVRGITAYLRITAPRYWWQEFVTYRIGCECLSSESTMHTIARGVEPEMFDAEYSEANALADCIGMLVDYYNEQTDRDKKEQAFIEIKRQLPECFIQTRIYAISYQTLRRMYFQRRTHRLPEWQEFCKFVKRMPHADELITVTQGWT